MAEATNKLRPLRFEQIVDVTEYQRLSAPVIAEIAFTPDSEEIIDVNVDLQRDTPLHQIPRELMILATGWVTITEYCYRVSIMKKNVKALGMFPLVKAVRHPKYD